MCHLETVTSLAGTVLFCACLFRCSYNRGPFTFQKCLGICPASSYNHGHTSSIMRAHLYPFRYQTHHDRDPQDKPLAPAAGDGILSISFDLVSRYNDRSEKPLPLKPFRFTCLQISDHASSRQPKIQSMEKAEVTSAGSLVNGKGVVSFLSYPIMVPEKLLIVGL